MTHIIARTCMMPWWQRYLAMMESKYVVKEYGDDYFHVYTVTKFFWCIPMVNYRASVHQTIDEALNWCERQINECRVKSVTYVMDDD